MRFLSSLALVFALAGCSTPPVASHVDGDLVPIGVPHTFANGRSSVRITRIRPAAAANTYEVTVHFTLAQMKRAEINFGAGENAAGRYVVLEKRIVEQLSGDAVAEVSLTKAYRSSDGVVSLHINLSEFPHEKRWSPVAGDRWDVRVPPVVQILPAGYKPDQVDQKPKLGASVRATREVLRELGLLGAAEVEVIITPEGTVKSAKVVRADNPEVGAAVAADALNWTFTPALKDGKPVACVMVIQSRSPLSPPDPVHTAYAKVRTLGFSGAFSVGAELDVQPRTNGAMPVDPPEKDGARVIGSAVVAFIVETDGLVKECKIVEASAPEIADMALRMLKKSRFHPGMKNGIAVRSALIIPFKIDKSENR